MSFYHENVTWPTLDSDGRLGHRIGFFAVEWRGEDEWDVEFDFSAFQWVSGIAATPDDAYRQWTGCNPGGGYSIPERNDATELECSHYDDMANACLNR